MRLHKILDARNGYRWVAGCIFQITPSWGGLIAAALALLSLPWSTIAAAAFSQQAYLKASNTGATNEFGFPVAIAGDTVVVGSRQESNGAVGINGHQNQGVAPNSGAAYVFIRRGTNWAQQAYLKASNAEADDRFGVSVAISGDTIVVGAQAEASGATGVNGDPSDNRKPRSGAAYVFIRRGTNWTQQAYLKASNTAAESFFGRSVAMSADTIVVGAPGEDGGAIGVNGDPLNRRAPRSGAAYVFVRHGTNWTQQAYLKASNTGAGDRFGYGVAISHNTVVIGADHEDSNATGINGNQLDDSATNSGAAYVFVRHGTNWSQQAYLKPPTASPNASFGVRLSISGDLVLVGGGGAWIFGRVGTNWTWQGELKGSHSRKGDFFGDSVGLADDTAIVGAYGDSLNATGVNGTQNDRYATNAGAAYVFVRRGANWVQEAYLKRAPTADDDFFGGSVAIFRDTVVIGAPWESSSATGINGDQHDNQSVHSGAAYIFTRAEVRELPRSRAGRPGQLR